MTATTKTDAGAAQRRATTLARRLFWSHAVLTVILLGAVGSTLWGLIGMNAMIAEVKSEHLADFEEEEQLHRSAWAIEVEARHGALHCDDPARVAGRLAHATRELRELLSAHAHLVSLAMRRALLGYQRFGERVSEGDVCALLRDNALERERWQLDEELTNSWIGKLRELRIAIAGKDLEAQRLGSNATMVGLGLGVLALIAAVFTARSVARGVTVPLALIAGHARRLGEGDFAPLPRIEEPYEVGQLSRELDRMRERMAEVTQLKEAFLNSVSHDLRTPLARMREALSLLVDGTVGPLNPKQQRVAALALRACEREIRLVSALLDLSRIRSGRPLRLQEEQRVDELIASAMESVQESAERAEVSLHVMEGEAVPDLVIDRVLVETALVNLLTNAVAATPKGRQVRISRALLKSGPDGSSGAWLRISVDDDGPGVAASLRDQVFEPFFTTKSGAESSGSGLGLPLAREMIRAHGGDVTLLEQRDGGAAFAIWLPVQAARPRSPWEEASESGH